jgi:hypothetical protein
MATINLYRDMQKALLGEQKKAKVQPFRTPTSMTKEQSAAHIMSKLLDAWKDKQVKETGSQDRASANKILQDYIAPQTPFSTEKYGTSPEDLMVAAKGYDGSYDDDDGQILSSDNQREFYTEEAKAVEGAYNAGDPSGAALVRQQAAAGAYNMPDQRGFLDKLLGAEEKKKMGPASEATMMQVLLGDKDKRDAVAAAKLARTQEMENYIKQQQNKAFAPPVEKRTNQQKNAIAMGLTPGTQPFNDYIRAASKLVPEAPNPLLTKHAEGLSKTIDDWTKKGRNAPGFLAKLGDLRGVLSSGVNQGFGQKFLNNAAALSKRMGWKVNEPNLGGAQVADSLINQLVVPRVKDLGAKPTDKDLQFIVDIFPKIQNQPGANELILQVLEIDSKRNIARAGFISKWLKENAKTDRYGLDFQANLQAFESSNDIFKEFVIPGWVKNSSSGKKLPPVPEGYKN